MTQRLKSLLSEPLGMDEAIQVALLNNQGLQAAYAELYFTDALWPDFNEAELNRALFGYSQRTRRFGLVSEQIRQAHTSEAHNL